MSIQDLKEINNWHKKNDPWDYENNPEDEKRRNYLISEIPKREYSKVLDIGCGQGYITRSLPGKSVLGVDISDEAIKKANEKHIDDRLSFRKLSLFELSELNEKYDLIIITGVLYPQYIGKSSNYIYQLIDNLLQPDGYLVSVHIDSWYKLRFPYLRLTNIYYPYRDFTHLLEVYVK